VAKVTHIAHVFDVHRNTVSHIAREVEAGGAKAAIPQAGSRRRHKVTLKVVVGRTKGRPHTARPFVSTCNRVSNVPLPGTAFGEGCRRLTSMSSLDFREAHAWNTDSSARPT
jgi:hypothetical protein